MSFNTRDIRRSMDVYTRDNVYLGTVLKIVPGPQLPAVQQVPDEARQSSLLSGELLGPAPTQPIGNRGPATQSARGMYAVVDGSTTEIGNGWLEVGKWQGLLGRDRIPVDAVLNVSLERVVLALNLEELIRP